MAAQLKTYSFLNVVAALTGPGAGAIPIGSDAGVSEEGITAEMEEDKDVMQGGADGSVMHALRAGNRGKITIRLLLTSPYNAALMLAYNFQKSSSSNWGQNTIIVTDISRGDLINAQQVAFARAPTTTYSKDGTMREWTFNVGQLNFLFGA